MSFGLKFLLHIQITCPTLAVIAQIYKIFSIPVRWWLIVAAVALAEVIGWAALWLVLKLLDY